MKIKSKDDLDNLVFSLINKRSFENKRDIFLTIREKTLEFYISNGSLIPPFYSLLYFIFNDIKIEADDRYVKHIDFFKNYYNQATLEEKYVISNFIFRLEILNGDFKNSIREYIKRWLILNLHKDFSNVNVKEFIGFIVNNSIDVKVLVESFKELIDQKYFFSLNFDEKRAVFVNALSILWNSPNSFNSNVWLEVFDDLVGLLNEMIKQNRIEEHMYIHFFTYHIFGNNIQTIEDWRVFNEKVEKLASRFYKEWGSRRNLIKPKTTISSGKKRVAFLVDRMIWTSPLIVLYSLIKALKSSKEFNENYEIYIYSLNYIDKNEDKKSIIDNFLKLGVNFFTPQNYFMNQGYYYSHLQKAIMLREKIIDDKIDFLIGGGGYDIPNFIFSTKTAPKQILWSHGNCTSDIEEIDKRISHFPQECKEWEWKIFHVPMDRIFLIGTDKNKEAGKRVKEKLLEEFGKDTVILGAIGRLVKVDSDEYLKTIAKIMEQNPNTIYLACGAGDNKTIKNRLKKYGIDEKRFIFTGFVNAHVYGWVIDLYLAPFPMDPGQALDEYRQKNRSYVAMHNQKWFENFKKSFKSNPKEQSFIKLYSDEQRIRLFNMQPLIEENRYSFTFFTIPHVLNQEDYVKVAIRLLKDKDLKEKIIDEYKYVKDRLRYDVKNFLKAIDD